MRIRPIALAAALLLAVAGCSVARPTGPDADLPIGCSQANISTTWGSATVGAAQALAAVQIAQVDDDGVGAALSFAKAGRFALSPTVRGEVGALRDPDWPTLLATHWSSVSGDTLPEFPVTVQEEFEVTALAEQTGRYVASWLVPADIVPFTVLDCRGDEFASGALVVPDPDRGKGGLLIHCDPAELGRVPASLTRTLTDWCAVSLSDGG
jgi:hypothetical protein